MLKFAICDDNAEDLEKVNSLLNRYHRIHSGLDLCVDLFSSSMQLLSQLDKESYHIYLLDIQMPDKNGIELGMEIRQRDKKAAIAYLTHYPEYAIDSYEVQAFYYMLKPLEQKRFFQLLDRLVKYFEKEANEFFVIRTANGPVSLSVQSILYLQYHSHYITYYLENGTKVDSVVVRNSFDQTASPLLSDNRFAKLSPSIIVNLMHVNRVEGKYFYLKDGTMLSVSRSYAESRKKFSEFLLKRAVFHD